VPEGGAKGREGGAMGGSSVARASPVPWEPQGNRAPTGEQARESSRQGGELGHGNGAHALAGDEAIVGKPERKKAWGRRRLLVAAGIF
jgi:hypothetical protein